ncbi:MAG: hypothetical protein AB7W16_20580 [Candidatus Obscuribacterales bacterium]
MLADRSSGHAQSWSVPTTSQMRRVGLVFYLLFLITLAMSTDFATRWRDISGLLIMMVAIFEYPLWLIQLAGDDRSKILNTKFKLKIATMILVSAFFILKFVLGTDKVVLFCSLFLFNAVMWDVAILMAFATKAKIAGEDTNFYVSELSKRFRLLLVPIVGIIYGGLQVNSPQPLSQQIPAVLSLAAPIGLTGKLCLSGRAKKCHGFSICLLRSFCICILPLLFICNYAHLNKEQMLSISCAFAMVPLLLHHYRASILPSLISQPE